MVLWELQYRQVIDFASFVYQEEHFGKYRLLDIVKRRLAGDAPVRASHRYLHNRLDCLDYPGALALGLPIGSGMIESGHRHVLQARLKRAGTAWLPEHADQIAHLRVLRANDQWLSLWN